MDWFRSKFSSSTYDNRLKRLEKIIEEQNIVNESDKDEEIRELRKEIKFLKNLYKKTTHSGENINTNKESSISQKMIYDYVEDSILSNSNLNVALIPDSIELETWTFVLGEIMEAFEKLSQHVNLDVMNHRVSVSIRPLTEQEKNGQDQ